jgi:hypothetical protein
MLHRDVSLTSLIIVALVTLNITLINRYGAWQSSDHRLSVRGVDALPVPSTKHMLLHCADATAVVTYAGLGVVGDVQRDSGIHVSDWMRKILRGEHRTVDATIAELRDAATRDLAPRLVGHIKYHMFSLVTFLGGRPWFVQIKNFDSTPDGELIDPRAEFEAVGRIINEETLVAAFPIVGTLNPSEYARLHRIGRHRPNRPEDFLKPLATVNATVANRDGNDRWISTECLVVHLPASGGPVEAQEYFVDGLGKGSSKSVPSILFGVDFTDLQRSQQEHFKAWLAGSVDADAREDEAQNYAREATRRTNPLGR